VPSAITRTIERHDRPDGSLLVADDVGDVIWRVAAAA